MLRLIAALTLSLALGTAFPSASTCTSAQAIDGCPTLSNPGTQVDVSTNSTSPASGGTTHNGASSNTNSAPRPSPKPTAKPCTDELCRESYTVGVSAEVFPEVSITDLVSFRPHAATVGGEPAGVGIVGMPTNVMATASTHDQRGELLGFPVLVRFVPQAYVFDFGDGTTLTSSTGGTSWATLRRAEFTPTPTSHSYRARGDYRVTVSVLYSAAVLFDDTFWRAVNGQVRGTIAHYDIRVVTASTALVDKTCLERPRGPGC